MSIITASQKQCLTKLKRSPFHTFSGSSGRTLQALSRKGLIENLRSIPCFDPTRGYAKSQYQATLTKAGKDFLSKLTKSKK